MAEYIAHGETVDGKKCTVYDRFKRFKGLQREPLTGVMMVLYELDRNCSVEITDEHGDDIVRQDNVHYAIGDKIKGDAIQLWVCSRRDDVKFEVLEGVTATHGGQLANTKKRAIGMIKYPFKFYDNSIGYTVKPQLK